MEPYSTVDSGVTVLGYEPCRSAQLDRARDRRMIQRRLWFLATSTLLVLFTACASELPSTPAPSATVYPLPVIPLEWAQDPVCAGVELSRLTLDGEVEDGVARVTANGDIPIWWPPGFTAVFTPTLVVRSPDGNDFARQGEDMHGVVWHGTLVCVHGDPDGPTGKFAIWIAPVR